MKKYQIALITSLLGGALANQGLANPTTPEIQVVALFKNTAVLNIDDHRTILRVGGKRQHNLRLLAANSEKAVFDVEGRRVEMALSQSNGIRTDLPVSGGHQAQLISNGGLYSVTGSIDGQLVDFVVDTGASYVTMSADQARRLRLDFSQARKVMMNTANGKTTAHVFKVKSIRVGSIELHNVEAAVMQNISNAKILLGMSFLNQVEMKHGPGLMVLKSRS
jgi:aspartyl protease family protein